MTTTIWKGDTVTTVYSGVDGAYPGQALPAGTRIVAGYIGAKDLPGGPDTPHIWTRDEWNLYLDPRSALFGGHDLRCLPIYVHDYPGDPVADANNAADAAIDLGWSHDRSRIIVWDAEFLSVKSYAAALHLNLNRLGFELMTYEKTVLQDPSADFRWIFRILTAGSPEPTAIPAGEDGWQWAQHDPWDLDIFSQAVYNHCGQGPRGSKP
jgi:hypothetical protein